MATANAAPTVYETELVALADLHPHPSNYRGHPESQRRHIGRSIREHGFYRNVVVARDGTILAGHGVVEAAFEEGLQEIPVVRLDLAADDPAALKVLTGDNEIARLALVDDTRLAALLEQVQATDAELLGTGFDEVDLAALLGRVGAPESFVVLDPETLETEHRCPSCGYEWSGSPAPGAD